MRRLAALLLVAVACSDGARKPEPAGSPAATVTATATPSASPTPSPAATAPTVADVDGLCFLVSDGSPEPLPPVVERVLRIPEASLDAARSKRYANAEVCRFTPPRKAAPYAEFFWGSPEGLSYDEHAASPTRVDEPSLPGPAYSYVEGDTATAVYRAADGEIAVTVGGLGAGGRDEAVALLREVLRPEVWSPARG